MKRFILCSLAVVVLCLVSTLAMAQERIENAYQNAFITETTDRDLEKAITMYQAIIDRPDADPNWIAKASYQMGVCYERLGKEDKALEAYQKATSSGLDSAIEVTQKARASFTRLKKQMEQEQLLNEAQSVVNEDKAPLRPWQRFRSSRHYLDVFGVDLAFNGDSGNEGLGLSLLGYEYIHTSGLALKIVPLSFTFTSTDKYTDNVEVETTHHVPVWLNYYFNGSPKKAWPFVGLGYDRFSVEKRTSTDVGLLYESQRKTGIAFQAGLSLGNSYKKRNVLALKVLPVGTSLKETAVTLSYDFLYSFQNK